MDNAVQANPPGHPVEVRAERNDARVWVEIIDVGPGIPADITVARGPVPSARGTGLGLMAARRFVEDSGGHLTLLSSERGTCCRVELPAALGAASAG
jgi:two-component system, OmpR family, sensor kinase